LGEKFLRSWYQFREKLLNWIEKWKARRLFEEFFVNFSYSCQIYFNLKLPSYSTFFQDRFMAIFLDDCASYPVFMADCTTEIFAKVITTRFTLEVGEKQIVCKNIDWLSIIWSIKEDNQAPAIINPAWLWHHFHLALDWMGIKPTTFWSWAECSTARA